VLFRSQRNNQLADDLHAFEQTFDQRADDLAAKVDAGDITGPLAGVPIAIKDNLCTEYGYTTCSSQMLENYRSPFTATAVKKLEAAGAIIIGKTVLDEFAMGSSTENAAFGSTQVKYAMNGFYHALMSRVGPQRARRMYFTGDPIDAQEAYRIGLIDELVPVGQLRESALRLAKHIAEMGPELATILKGVALRASNMDHLGALTYELTVTHDLTQRDLFRERTPAGHKRLQEGRSAATERIRTSTK